MNLSALTPDDVVLWQWGWAKLNLTILNTWIVMAVLTVLAWLATRKLSSGVRLSRWQNIAEFLVETLAKEISDITQESAVRYVPLIGSVFLLIAMSNMLSIVPGFEPPTASLSTTAALAICVLVAVPAYGISSQGVLGYLKQYFEPTVFMFPFNVIGEISRTVALAVRLFGNMMSGSKIAAVLLAIAPLFFPVIMQFLGLLLGFIQAYIFAILAMVYIASAVRGAEKTSERAVIQQRGE
jgi:F-type H+-transporting ATPase subunit a